MTGYHNGYEKTPTGTLQSIIKIIRKIIGIK